MRSVRAWAWVGGLVGALIGVLAFAPAAWLARSLSSATGGQLLLADAAGTVWHGTAQLVVSGGEGSRDATSLPGRLRWRFGLKHGRIEVRAWHACCLNGEVKLHLEPGFGRVRLTLPPGSGTIGQWPASLLAGLGSPWNTMQPGGVLRLSSPGLSIESGQGRWVLDGNAQLAIDSLSSPLAPVPTLGSYHLQLSGTAAAADSARLVLSTTRGPLWLEGEGLWAARKLRFRGQARAEPGAEAGLDNLLNLIGRREGAVSVLTFG